MFLKKKVKLLRIRSNFVSFRFNSKAPFKTTYGVVKPKSVDLKFAESNFLGPVIAILGRPNVGKSTLFNRLAGSEVAIVHSTAGVTRDRKIGQGRLSDLKFQMIDTPGYEEISKRSKNVNNPKTLLDSMIRQADLGLSSANGVIFLVDAKEGILSDDYALAKWLKKKKRCSSFSELNKRLPVKLIANKSESKDKNNFLCDVYGLQMGDPTYISAKHNLGIADLYNTMKELIEDCEKISGKESLSPVKEMDPLLSKNEKSDIQLAIVGRPNVGKSTLLNSLIRIHNPESPERAVTSEMPNTTRDSVSVNLKHKDCLFKLVDTAGIIGPSRMSWRKIDKEKSLAMDDSLRAMGFANVVCQLVETPKQNKEIKKAKENQKLNPEKIFTKKDLSIAKKVLEEGRSLLIVLNKIDLLEGDEKTVEKICRAVSAQISKEAKFDAGKLEVIAISALKSQNLEILLDKVKDLHKIWSARTSTSLLNKWLNKIFKFAPPPRVDGKAVKIRFITQLKARPPTFALFTNLEVPQNFQKLIVSKLREEFKMDGIPVRLVFKKKENPFITKAGKLKMQRKRLGKGFDRSETTKRVEVFTPKRRKGKDE